MTGTEVHLAIYDLSRGMARSLSTQFLGANHAIDIVPHTGIIAFGKEYLFGSMGIDFMDPSEFRRSHQIFPIEVQSLGYTQRSQEEFDHWCSRVSGGVYSGSNYNLFHRNCNNFSHDAALQGLGLSRGVPTWILETPTQFLSSPLGQMITPMLGQMQISGPQTGSNFSNQQQRRHESLSTARVETSRSQINPRGHAINNATNDKKTTDSTPILDSHNCTLLSTDKSSLVVCINKLLDCQSDSQTVLVLSQLRDYLVAEEPKVPNETLQTAVDVLTTFLNTGKKANSLHSLIVLRLAVVYIKDSCVSVSVLSTMSSYIHSEDSHITKNPSTLSMTWCVISNAMGSICGTVDQELLTALIDQAVSTINAFNQGALVRQTVSAFLYNATHYLTSTHTNNAATPDQDSDYFLDDAAVSILCGTIEGLATENDSLTKLRRLMVVGKLLRPGKVETENAKRHFTLVQNLLLDLGFLETLSTLSKRTQNITVDPMEKKIVDFSSELALLLETVE